MSVSIELLWKKIAFNPTDDQKNAILHEKGHLYIIAGPGSGKTRVLLWRTVNLIVFCGVSPEDIMLTTFTEKAARQLKDGLQSLLALASEHTGVPYDISRMYIGTIHSNCRLLLRDRRFSQKGSRPKVPAVLDALHLFFFIGKPWIWKEILESGGYTPGVESYRTITDGISGRGSGSKTTAQEALIGVFSRFSEEQIERKKDKDPFVQSMLQMYAAYREILVRENLIDLSLLQQEALNKAEQIENVFKHIIVDEYQDTNSIQERLFFTLTGKTGNLCVVGDDDQALYRFRGATVENFVLFEDRCKAATGHTPSVVRLSNNYRSMSSIVELYGRFMDKADWKDKGKSWRLDKNIVAGRQETGPGVILTSSGEGSEVCEEIAKFISDLKKKKKITDYNQCAILFPSLGATKVELMRTALEKEGIEVYAPRAGLFLECEEALLFWGITAELFGYDGHRHESYSEWISRAVGSAQKAILKDRKLKKYLDMRKGQIEEKIKDYLLLARSVAKAGYDIKDEADEKVLSCLKNTAGLSAETKRALGRQSLLNNIYARKFEKKPSDIKYLMNRVSSLDWTLLDIFYQLLYFDVFKNKISLKNSEDEAPVFNLSRVSQYLSMFNEQHGTVISSEKLSNGGFINIFMNSFTYALFRLEESEYENKEIAFPLGRVPFLTIHQSKGLEFPVVVLGSTYRAPHLPKWLDKTVYRIAGKKGEPLELQSHYDSMRMFYVALSRAMNLLVIPDYVGRGPQKTSEFKELTENDTDLMVPIQNVIMKEVSDKIKPSDDISSVYSYTADYIAYNTCPRNYMYFRKYGFAPSRAPTQFFGSLVHQTVEDLHQYIIYERGVAK